MGNANTEHPVVALCAGALRQLIEGARDRLIQQRLVLRHMATDGVDDGLAHVAQDVGPAHRTGIDHLTLRNGAIEHGFGRDEPHQRRPPWAPGCCTTIFGRVPNSSRFIIKRSTSARTAVTAKDAGCLSHSNSGLTRPSRTRRRCSIMRLGSGSELACSIMPTAAAWSLDRRIASRTRGLPSSLMRAAVCTTARRTRCAEALSRPVM